MTPDQLKAEAKWMLDYIRREWRGREPHSRFARSLPLVLRAFMADSLPPDVRENNVRDEVCGICRDPNCDNPFGKH
jgi:hypothetical protein